MSPRDLLLVLNAGSSTLKFAVFRAVDDGDPKILLEDQIEGSAAEAIPAAGARLRERFGGEHVVAVGHRVVHGGPNLGKPMRLDAAVLAELERLVPLAPLHLPASLECIRAVSRWRADVPQILCFDTAFHRTHDLLADLYALPWDLHEAGVRRYGFHGISYESIALSLPKIAPEIAGGRVIAAHLGNGASLCAMRAGRSVDSTMGFSVLDGLVMGTRPGQLDPGILLYLLGHRGMPPKEVERLLYHESGLKGLSGATHDMRALLSSSDPKAKIAIDAFVHRAAKEIGALAASLGGVDALVFTAGIGENSPAIRERIVAACAWLGAALDPAANARGGPRISAPGSRVSAWVVPTHEDFMIARHTLSVIRSG